MTASHFNFTKLVYEVGLVLFDNSSQCDQPGWPTLVVQTFILCIFFTLNVLFFSVISELSQRYKPVARNSFSGSAQLKLELTLMSLPK